MGGYSNGTVDRCFVCYTNSKEDSFAPIFDNEGLGKGNMLLQKQLKVVYLLKKLLDIPESTCCNFLKNYGNPSSWIYCCYPCSILVDESKRLYDQVVLLERKIDIIRRNLKSKISSSAEDAKCSDQSKIKGKPTEILRGLILEDTCLLTLSAAVEVKMDNTSNDDENSNASVKSFSDNESSNNFSISGPGYDDVENDTMNLVNTSTEMSEEDHRSLKLEKSLKENVSKKKANASQRQPKVTIEKANLKSPESNKNSKDTTHECSICLATFSRMTKLKTHQLIHPPPCPFCQEQFSNKEEYESHLMVHKSEEIKNKNCTICHQDFEEFLEIVNHKCTNMNDLNDATLPECEDDSSESNKCSQCGKTFKFKKYLNQHMKIHGDPDKRNFQCSNCPKAYRVQKYLRAHEKTHQGILLECDICGKNLSTHQKLATHKKYVHCSENLKKPFECETCGKSFLFAASLNKHNVTHTGNKPNACQVCDMKFSTKYGLKEHVRIHTGEQPFVCPFCPERFSNRKAWKRHERAHNGEPPPHPCSFCEKRFHTNSDKTRHERTHTGEKPHSCTICGKCFPTVSAVFYHTKTHNSEKSFLCPICGKSFLTKRYLKDHEVLHTLQEKTFACQFCDKKFTKKKNAISHERIHTGETTFPCSVCDVRFKTERLLRTHLRTHGIKPQPYTRYSCKLCKQRFTSKIDLKEHKKSHSKGDYIIVFPGNWSTP